MFSVHLNWWKFVLYSGYFILLWNIHSGTAANTGGTASFVKLIAYLDGDPDEATFQTVNKVLMNALKLNGTELWKCPNFTREPISGCNDRKGAHCSFFEGNGYTQQDIDVFNHKLQDINTTAQAYVAGNERQQVTCAKGYLIADPAEYRPFQQTQHPDVVTIYKTYVKVNLTIEKPCDENAILKATTMLRTVLHLDDRKIWRCQDDCTVSTCLGDKLTLCLFFEADAYNIINSTALNSSLSHDVPCSSGVLVCHKVPCSSRRLVPGTSIEYWPLHEIAERNTTGIIGVTGNKEAQTAEVPRTGAIVGGTVGGLAGLAGAVAAGWGILRKLKKNQVDDTASTGDTTPITPGGIDFEEAPNSIPPAGV